jgi:hypothetical protein
VTIRPRPGDLTAVTGSSGGADHRFWQNASQEEGTDAMGSAPGTCAGPRFGDSRRWRSGGCGRGLITRVWRRKLAIRGTRLSVALILESLANGMSLDGIDSAFDHSFPHEVLPELLNVVSELTDSFHVAG